MTALSLADLREFRPAKVELNAENLSIAAEALQQLWNDRQKSLYIKPAGDRPGSSKFGALLARELFGGTLAGNSEHVFVLHGDLIIDLNQNQQDVRDLSALAHIDIPQVLAGEEFRTALGNCIPLVEKWTQVAIAKIEGPSIAPKRVREQESPSMSI